MFMLQPNYFDVVFELLLLILLLCFFIFVTVYIGFSYIQ